MAAPPWRRDPGRPAADFRLTATWPAGVWSTMNTSRTIARNAVLAVLALAGVTACQDMMGIPNVEGTYTGRMTITSIYGGITGSGSMRIVAEQSGSQVSLSGSITFEGVTVGIAAGSGTVDRVGVYTPDGRNAVSTESLRSACGTLTPVTHSIVFSNGNVEFDMSLRYSICGLVNYHAVLSR